jgi:O-antigen ligase
MNLNPAFEEKIINSKLNYIIILIPFLLITGPFLPDLIVTISSLYFFVCTLIYKEFTLFKKFFFRIFLFFYLICVISSLFSEYKLYSLKSSLPYIRFGLFFLLVYFYFIKDKKFLKNLFFVLLTSYVILIIDGFFQFSFGFNLFGKPIIASRVSSFFNDELVLGSYISRFLPLLIGLSIYTKFIFKKNYKLLIYFVIFCSTDFNFYIRGKDSIFFHCTYLYLLSFFLAENFEKNFNSFYNVYHLINCYS